MKSISGVRTRKKKSPKPFEAHYIDTLISCEAPHLYSKQEMGQVKDVSTNFNKAVEIQKKADEIQKGKKKKDEMPPPPQQIVKKKLRNKFFSNLQKGSTSKKASKKTSTSRKMSIPMRASTPPPRPVLLPPSNRRAYSL